MPRPGVRTPFASGSRVARKNSRGIVRRPFSQGHTHDATLWSAIISPSLATRTTPSPLRSRIEKLLRAAALTWYTILQTSDGAYERKHALPA